MRGFLPSRWRTAANLPTADYQILRYQQGAGGSVEQVQEGGVPLQADAPLVLGAALEISRTG
jgi:hypothetical protein